MNASQHRPNVLLLDRNPARLRLLAETLSAAGYRVETAGNGEAALRLLHSADADLIVAEAGLCTAEGLRLLPLILAAEELEQLPVLALGMDRARTDPDAGLAGLFDGCFSDPLNPAEVLQRLAALDPGGPAEPAETILEHIETGLPRSQFAPATAVSLLRIAVAVASEGRAGVPDYLRRAAQLTQAHTARARCGFQWLIRLCRERLSRAPEPPSPFDELRSQYLDHSALEIHRLAEALEQSDFPALARGAHNLKGTGAAYGFRELTELGRELESAAKAKDLPCAEAALEKTEFYVHLVRLVPGRLRRSSDAGIAAMSHSAD